MACAHRTRPARGRPHVELAADGFAILPFFDIDESWTAYLHRVGRQRVARVGGHIGYSVRHGPDDVDRGTQYPPEVPRVRALALAVIRRPGTGHLFVDEIVEPGTGKRFHRPAGGGIEFGERAAQTLERELLEEYALAITVGRQLGVLESHFTYAGRAGHEIVLVHEARLTDPADYEPERRPCLDQPHVYGVWRSPEEKTIPLYPAGLADLLEMDGRQDERAGLRAAAPYR